MEYRTQSIRAPRPTWMLLVIALPVGVLVNGLTGGFENLSGALLLLMGWEHEPTMLQRWLVKTVSHMVVPGLLSFAVLKVTRLGDWLAPNRLALGALLLADGLLVGYAAWSLYQAGTGGIPFLLKPYSSIVGVILTWSAGIGMVSLVASTVWQRLVRDKPLALVKFGGLLREI